LGFEVRAVTEVGEESLTILYISASGSEKLPPREVIANCDAFCAEVANRGQPLHIEDTATSEWANHPAYTKLGLNAYVGSPIRFSDGRKGSVCFLSSVKRTSPLPESIHDHSLLLAQRIESVLERLEVSEALRESEALFRATFKQASVCIAHVGTDGSWLKVNQSICDILGYTEQELSALKFQDVTHTSDLNENPDLLANVLKKEAGQYSLRKRYIKRNGATVWTNLTMQLVRDKHGKPQYFISIIEDITEKRRAEETAKKFEERVQEAQKLESLGVLAGGIAHDFNNLLTAILGNAIMAKESVGENSTLWNQLKQIETAAHHAADLTNQLLAYGGKGTLVSQRVDLSELIEEMQQLFQSVLSKQTEIIWSHPDQSMMTQADPSQLRQVIMNLLTNASEAMEDRQGKIAIEIDRIVISRAELSTDWVVRPQEGEHIRLQVVDQGVGMDGDIQKRLFEPFFTSKFVGCGLGLSAVLVIIRRHAGGIRIKSALGEGTTITVVLPAEFIAPDDVGQTKNVESSKKWRTKGTALIVDDEEHVRIATEAMIQQLRFTDVITANDGDKAINIIQDTQQTFSVILLDVTMPGPGLEQTFKQIKTHSPTSAIVLMSGYNEQHIESIIDIDQRAQFLKKPFTFETMTDSLQQVIKDIPRPNP
jgi:PAS domain S-box-containing protein